MGGTYYWLKLKNNFFQRKEIKKLRKSIDGDTYTIIYLKMLLLSIETGGFITYDGVEDTFEEELALMLDEDIEKVKVVVSCLLKHKLLEKIDECIFFMTEILDMLGAESDSAARVRKHREKKALEKQVAEKITINQKETLDNSALQSNNVETLSNITVTNGNTDIEIELDIDREDLSAEPTPRSLTILTPDADNKKITLKEAFTPQNQPDSIKKTKKSKNKIVNKVHFAEFVSMTNDEYSSLVAEHGKPMTLELIKILDNYKGSTGKPYNAY